MSGAAAALAMRWMTWSVGRTLRRLTSYPARLAEAVAARLVASVPSWSVQIAASLVTLVLSLGAAAATAICWLSRIVVTVVTVVIVTVEMTLPAIR